MNGYRMNILEYTVCEDPAARFDFESHIFENVWYGVVEHLPTKEALDKDMEAGYNSIDIWYDSDKDEIMCRTEELANIIANIIEGISGEKEAHTGYFDPEEDERDNCVDENTGWYYVTYD